MSTPVPAPNRPADRPAAGSPLALVVAWTVVGVPAAWGVLQTLLKSLALFR